MDGSQMQDAVFEASAAELRQFVERIEAVAAEKKEAADREKEVYAEAKSRGYLVMPLRALIRERRKNPDDLAEEMAVLDLYRRAMDGGV